MAGYGNDGIVNLLLDHGANAKAIDRDGQIALHIAANTRCVFIIETLLQHVAFNGHVMVVASLLKFDANMLIKNAWGATVLQYVVLHGHTQVVKLLASGNDVNAVSQHGMTMFHFNESDSNYMVALNRESALHLAIKYGHEAEKIVKILFTHDSNFNAVDRDGKTALHLVVEYDGEEVTEIVLAHGSDVNG
ncbi:MAG: hypothetical protein Q9195_000701, partial [Heterodermia aff. obscurata]